MPGRLSIAGNPAGFLFLTISLLVSLACYAPASPASRDSASEPTPSLPAPPSTVTQPTPLTSLGAATVDTGSSPPEAMPYFHLLGGDPDLPEFGRVSVNLDYVAGKMAESGNIAFVPILVDFLRVQLYYEGRTTFSAYLDQLVGDEQRPGSEQRDDWKRWSQWLGNHPVIKPPQGYAEWKGRFLAHIDPGMAAFFYDAVETQIRLEEAVWGGVPKDGIPDLVNPPAVSGRDARYLNPDDRVFGVSIKGEHPAFPLRILNPHEMANGTLGGVPIILAN